jgi:hypothetical protein
MPDIRGLLGVELVMTEKLDGSNLCLTRGNVFARSHSGAPGHPSFNAAKRMHAQIKERIPEGISVFGEWCYAVHSIQYVKMPHWFFVFGVRDDNTEVWKSWVDVQVLAGDLGLETAPLLRHGVCLTEADLRGWTSEQMWRSSEYGGEREGVVVRVLGAFRDENFEHSVGKLVRANHVQTDSRWAHGPIKKQPVGK